MSSGIFGMGISSKTEGPRRNGWNHCSYISQLMAVISNSLHVIGFVHSNCTASRILVVVSGQSTRPRDTAKPLANALGLKLQMPCDKVGKERKRVG